MENLEAPVNDVSILVAPPPRGLGLDLEDRSLTETLKRNPEVLTKEAVQHLLKRRFITAIAGKSGLEMNTRKKRRKEQKKDNSYLINSHALSLFIEDIYLLKPSFVMMIINHNLIQAKSLLSGHHPYLMWCGPLVGCCT